MFGLSSGSAYGEVVDIAFGLASPHGSGDRFPDLFTHVPAWVCTGCGEIWIEETTLREAAVPLLLVADGRLTKAGPAGRGASF